MFSNACISVYILFKNDEIYTMYFTCVITSFILILPDNASIGMKSFLMNVIMLIWKLSCAHMHSNINITLYTCLGHYVGLFTVYSLSNLEYDHKVSVDSTECSLWVLHTMYHCVIKQYQHWHTNDVSGNVPWNVDWYHGCTSCFVDRLGKGHFTEIEHYSWQEKQIWAPHY